MIRCLFAICVLLVSIARCAVATSTNFVALPDDIQLIAPPPTNLPALGIQWMSQWPSRQEILGTLATKDISGEINGPVDFSRKPERPMAISPRGAAAEAASWAMKTLGVRPAFRNEDKDGWAPRDLESRQCALRASDPVNSRVIGRFELDGNRFQTIQTKAWMCVVIRPSDAVRGDTPPERMGDLVFRRFFEHGEDIMKLERKEMNLPTDSIRVFQASRKWATEWWHAVAWYTDGKAVAVTIHKVEMRQLRHYLEGPWF